MRCPVIVVTINRNVYDVQKLVNSGVPSLVVFSLDHSTKLTFHEIVCEKYDSVRNQIEKNQNT